jgi:hypothetical protein
MFKLLFKVKFELIIVKILRKKFEFQKMRTALKGKSQAKVM